MKKPPQAKEPTPFASATFAAGCAYLSYKLWPGSYGSEELKFFSFSAGIVSGVLTLTTVSLLNRKMRRILRKFRAFSQTSEQGSAGFLSEEEARQHGLHHITPGSRFVGTLGSSPLWMKTETHTLIIGPAGSSKSSAQIMNQLASVEESCLVSDVKGELLETTGPMRAKKFGHKIIKLDPTADDSASINPIDLVFIPLMESSPRALSRARGIALQLYPEPETEGANKFFRDGTRILIATLILAVAATCPKDKRNMTTVYRALTDEVFMNALLMDAGRSSLLNGEVAQMADDINAMANGEDGSAKTYEQFRIGAMQALEAFGPGNYLAKISSKTDMSFRTLKTEPCTIYITVDFRLKDVLGRWVGLMQWLAAEELVDERNNTPVHFILDEFCNSPLHGLPTILTLLRSYGIRVTMATQDLDDITRVYGKHALETIVSEASIKIFLSGTKSKATLEFISAYMGDQTLNTSSFNLEDNDVRESISKNKRPLMTPDEIRRLADDLQIVFYKNLKPIIAKKVPIFAIEPWCKEIAPNSMYGGKRYLLPVQVTIKKGKSVVTKLGHGIQFKNSNFWPRARVMWSEFTPPPIFGFALVFLLAVLLIGFPHIRWSYNYSGSYSNPTAYYQCHYIGPRPFIKSTDCPMVIFKKLW